MRLIAGAWFVVALWTSPATADVSARYENRDESSPMEMVMTYEVSDAGEVRLQMGNVPGYYLLRENELYSVNRGYDGPVVVRVAELMQLQSEFAAQMFRSDIPEPEDFPGLQFAPMGEEDVNGRTGTAYGMVSDDGGEPARAQMVIGNQPALAPIGAAMQRMNEALTRNMPSMFAVLARANEDMQAVLGQGAPLRILDLVLTDVSTNEIPEERFLLPAEPLTMEQLRAQTVPFDVPPTLPPSGE